MISKSTAHLPGDWQSFSSFPAGPGIYRGCFLGVLGLVCFEVRSKKESPQRGGLQKKELARPKLPKDSIMPQNLSNSLNFRKKSGKCIIKPPEYSSIGWHRGPDRG
ncbi:MAG: hypothetical protein DRQ02_08875 [Candidatus Latescibacterota bacterium]|nr:MAG: hypothetical protein DRQ02_08875 [Candidatus Latescibacterota bacterium]